MQPGSLGQRGACRCGFLGSYLLLLLPCSPEQAQSCLARAIRLDFGYSRLRYRNHQNPSLHLLKLGRAISNLSW
jgi:hypothetical protein